MTYYAFDHQYGSRTGYAHGTKGYEEGEHIGQIVAFESRAERDVYVLDRNRGCATEDHCTVLRFKHRLDRLAIRRHRREISLYGKDETCKHFGDGEYIITREAEGYES